jgi:hypothetical protein
MILCAWLAGCGDVAGLAEPPPERTAWADVQAEGYGVAGDIVFADGLRVGARVFAAAPLGRTMQVQFPVTGLAAGTELAVGVRAPRAAARQVIAGQSRRVVGSAEDPRDRWAAAVVDGAVATATVELADGWHPQHAVVVLAVTRGGEIVPAISGPRMDRGAGVLGVLPATTRPTQVTATAGTPVIDGALGDEVWRGQAGALLGLSLDGEPDPEARAIDAAADPLAPGRGTRVRFAWDAEFLYCAASLPDADMWTDYVDQDDPLYKQEAFELFVAGSGEGTRYLEFQVSARGVTFDAQFATHRKGDEALGLELAHGGEIGGDAGARGSRPRVDDGGGGPVGGAVRAHGDRLPAAPGNAGARQRVPARASGSQAHQCAGAESDPRAGLPRVGQRRRAGAAMT